MGTTKQTLIEEGTQLKGTLSSDCPVVVRGRLDGEVSGPLLQVSPTGKVSGKIEVQRVESAGELAGEYKADVVRLSGRVADETVIRTKSLEVKLAGVDDESALVLGDCELEVGNPPTKEDAVRQANEARKAKRSGSSNGGASADTDAVASEITSVSPAPTAMADEDETAQAPGRASGAGKGKKGADGKRIGGSNAGETRKGKRIEAARGSTPPPAGK